MQVGSRHYEAEIRRTTHGVAHIRGASLPDVVFGQAYAIAGDHLPTIADQLLKTRSGRAAHFGPGENDQHVNSDFGYLAMGIEAWAERMLATQPDRIIEVVHAYAAGLNEWLQVNGTEGLPDWCRGAAWIRPVDALDLFGLYADMALMASGRNVAQFVGAAQPPGGPAVHHPDGPLIPTDHPGSNGWALGGDATVDGRGIVVANPHFPWYGDGRFWECHLTVPGELDVYGVCLVGAPGVQIGFNRDVAWTHTFSAGNRFNFYSLTLDPDDPTRYVFGDETREITHHDHSIRVLNTDGSTGTVDRRMWASHYGPMLDVPLLGWSSGTAFSLADANHGNDRFLAQFLAMDAATDVGSLRDTVRQHQGLPWVNTLAADRHGDAWYADMSTTPKLSTAADEAFDEAASSDPLTMLFITQRVALLDGSDPANEWVEDPRAIAPGLVAVDDLPESTTRGIVFNSNDPYWVTGPDLRLDRHPAFCGLYRRPLSSRTRANGRTLAGDGVVSPTGQGGFWTMADMERALLGNHSLVADQLLDAVAERCASSGEPDLVNAAGILTRWDHRYDLESRGGVLWREFLAGFDDATLRGGGNLFSVPFDPSDPLNTPKGLAAAPASGPDPVLTAMRAALDALRSVDIEPDAPLGEVQFIERSGQRIPLHGGFEVEGIINVVSPNGSMARSDLEPPVPSGQPIPGRTERTGLTSTGYPCTYGASMVMVVGFDDEGPVARGLLTYGQSGDPDSPHHADQMQEFSAKRLRPLLFHDRDIEADPHLRTEWVTGGT